MSQNRQDNSGQSAQKSGITRPLNESQIRGALKCIGAVLALCVSGLFAPPLARGQGVAYLSNADQPVTASALGGSFSIGFKTGTNSSGYLLDSLSVLFADNNIPQLMSAGLDDYSTTTSFQDGVEVGAAGYYTFAPNSPLALAANTSYALLVYPDDPQVDVNLSYTTSSDFTSVDNWNIPGIDGSDEPLFTIMATPVTPAPEPSVTVLVCTSIFTFIVLGLTRMVFSNSKVPRQGRPLQYF